MYNMNNLSSDAKILQLQYNNITEINWESFPQCLQQIYIHHNEITEMNWEGSPDGYK